MPISDPLGPRGPAREGEPNPMASFVLMGVIFAIFYFVLILPMKKKQKKLEELVKGLKPGDKVVINPGILGTVEGVDDETLACGSPTRPGSRSCGAPSPGSSVPRRPDGEADAPRLAEPLRAVVRC